MKARKARLDLLGLTLFPATRFHDRDGAPIGLGRYSELLQDPTYCVVARTEIDGLEVVTVWAGMDDRDTGALLPADDGRAPLVFRTEMRRAGELVGIGARYSTVESAAEGHEVVTARVRELLDRGYLKDSA